MRAPCVLLALVLGGGLTVSSEVPAENLAPAVVGSLFGLEPEEPAAAPRMTLRQALDRAETWVREQAVDTSGQLLHSVSLRYDESPARRGAYWLAQWMWLEPRLGGELSVRVDMDGTVTAKRLGP